MASNVLPRFQPGCIAATVAIAVPGCGGVDGDAEGEADGEVLADWPGDGDVVPSTVPVQVTPLRAKEVGAALLPDQDPLKPKETVAFVAMAAL
jgi:nicotinamide mononucleotide (NMN) deamidase PncC